jgi:hypothetical protein
MLDRESITRPSEEQAAITNAALCLSCANVFSATAKQAICPVCGDQLDVNLFLRLMVYSRLAMRFGYQYRKAYSRDLLKGPIRTKYLLKDFGDWFAFVGLAVLSGVIGNASYDLIKHLVWKFCRERAVSDRVMQKPFSHIEFDDAEIEKLIGYVEDLCLRGSTTHRK